MPPPPLGRTVPLAPPLAPASVYALPDLDALDALDAGAEPGFIYARDGHPNARQLADELNEWEGAAWGVACASGMAAVAAALVPWLAAGDAVLAGSRLYGRTYRLLLGELTRFGVRVTVADLNDLPATEAALRETGAKALVAETVSNPTGRVADVPALAELCHRFNARLIVDNTFCTPALFRPLDHEADLVVESLTKLIAGHSDVTLGYLGGRDEALGKAIAPAVSTWGMSAAPFDCWLALRGLETLELRANAAATNARAVAHWLQSRPDVARVEFSALPGHPDHALAARMLPKGPGHVLAFELPGGRDAVNRLFRAAPELPFAPSLGHTRTTLSYPDATSHRAETAGAKLAQGITPGLVRLSAGCEPLPEILAPLSRGLAAASHA